MKTNLSRLHPKVPFAARGTRPHGPPGGCPTNHRRRVDCQAEEGGAPGKEFGGSGKSGWSKGSALLMILMVLLMVLHYFGSFLDGSFDVVSAVSFLLHFVDDLKLLEPFLGVPRWVELWGKLKCPPMPTSGEVGPVIKGWETSMSHHHVFLASLSQPNRAMIRTILQPNLISNGAEIIKKLIHRQLRAPSPVSWICFFNAWKKWEILSQMVVKDGDLPMYKAEITISKSKVMEMTWMASWFMTCWIWFLLHPFSWKNPAARMVKRQDSTPALVMLFGINPRV